MCIYVIHIYIYIHISVYIQIDRYIDMDICTRRGLQDSGRARGRRRGRYWRCSLHQMLYRYGHMHQRACRGRRRGRYWRCSLHQMLYRYGHMHQRACRRRRQGRCWIARRIGGVGARTGALALRDLPPLYRHIYICMYVYIYR